MMTWQLESIGQTVDWELRKSKKGIEVYTRSVEGFSLDECKGIVIIHASVDQLVTTLKNVEDYVTWYPDCVKAELLESELEEHIHYFEIKAPFPVSNRDGYYRNTYHTQEGELRVELEALPEYQPEIKGLVRVPFTKGHWLLEEINDEQTRVTYQVHADPGGSIPAWLANAVVVSNPFETLENLKAYHE
jgi:hypothetical protein